MAIDINKMMSVSGSYSKHKKGEVPFRRTLPPEYMEDAKKEIPLEGEPIDNVDMFNGDIPTVQNNKLIPLEDLIPASADFNPYPPADDDTMAAMIMSIAKYGQLKVCVVRQEKNGKFMIIGGHNRYRAITALHEMFPEVERYKYMRCNIYSLETINDEAFKIAVVEDNEAQRAKEDKRMLAVGYKVRKENLEKSSLENFGTTYGAGIKDKLAEKYKLSNGTASRIAKISNLVRPYMDLYINHELSDSDALVIAGLKYHLQEFLLSQNIIKFDTYKRSLVAKCDTLEDLKAAIKATPENMYNGVITEIAMPKTSKNLTLPISTKDKKTILEAFSDVVRKLDLKDETGKQFLIQVLEGYSQMK